MLTRWKIIQSTYIAQNKYTYINAMIGSDEERLHDEMRRWEEGRHNNQSINRSIKQSRNQPTNQSINQSIDQWVNQLNSVTSTSKYDSPHKHNPSFLYISSRNCKLDMTTWKETTYIVQWGTSSQRQVQPGIRQAIYHRCRTAGKVRYALQHLAQENTTVNAVEKRDPGTGGRPHVRSVSRSEQGINEKLGNLYTGSWVAHRCCSRRRARRRGKNTMLQRGVWTVK